MFKYTDGTQVVEALLLENNRRSIYYAFNFINNRQLESMDVPEAAIRYIFNNESITLRNQEVVYFGDYIIKDSGGIHPCTAVKFAVTYTKVQ